MNRKQCATKKIEGSEVGTGAVVYIQWEVEAVKKMRKYLILKEDRVNVEMLCLILMVKDDCITFLADPLMEMAITIYLLKYL